MFNFNFFIFFGFYFEVVMRNNIEVNLILGSLSEIEVMIRVVKLILYVIIFIIGIVGNLLVCLVVCW